MKTAAMLLRVSTEQQDMESQKNVLLPVIKDYGYEVPNKYIFGQKITGRDNVREEDRKSIKDLKSACLKGGIDAIFICEVSRLSRDPIAGRLYVQEFNEMKIPIYFNDLKMWTLNRETLQESESAFYIGIHFDIAKNELKTFKSRTIRGRKQNAREGKVTGSYIKFGYKKDAETKKYIIDEVESAFVLDLYKKYATGEYSIRSLTNYANSTGMPTQFKKSSKKGKFTTRGGITKSTDSVTWTTQVIRSILVDKIYIGERTFSDITYNVPAIVSVELFNEVQERLKTNVHTIEKTKHIHILQRIMYCGVCGSYYYGHYKERSNSYLCSNYTRAAINCNNTTLNYERAESIIWDYIKNQTYFFKKINEEEKNKLITDQTTKKQELLKNRDNYLKLKEDEELKVKNLIELVTSGAFKMDEIISNKTKIDKTISSYEAELAKIDGEVDRIDKRIDYINNQNLTEQALSNLESDRKLMQEKVREVIDKIVVYKLDDKIALLQVNYLDKLYNLMYYYRKQSDRYYYVENDVATFNNPNEASILGLPVSFPEFTVTDSNNSTFNGEVFGEYTGVQLINILEKYNLYRDYEKFDKIIPNK